MSLEFILAFHLIQIKIAHLRNFIAAQAAKNYKLWSTGLTGSLTINNGH